MPSFPKDGDYRICLHDPDTDAEIHLSCSHDLGTLIGPSDNRPYTTVGGWRHGSSQGQRVKETPDTIFELVGQREYELTVRCYDDMLKDYGTPLKEFFTEDDPNDLFGLFCELWELNPDVMCCTPAAGTLLLQVLRNRDPHNPKLLRLELQLVLELLKSRDT